MRTVRCLLLVCCALAACGAPMPQPQPEPEPQPQPQPQADPPLTPTTTGLVLSVKYDKDGIVRLTMSGATAVTGRKFGPYEVSPTKLAPGQTAGFLFDPEDAGGVMVCAEAFKRDGDLEANGCGTYELRAGEVVTGILTLIDLP
jgi:hypothetical protein